MSADLYHIVLERSDGISNLPQGKYIEPSEATAYRQLNNRICDHKCSACKEKRTESVKTFSVLFLSVGTISIESKTVLKGTFPLQCFFQLYDSLKISSYVSMHIFRFPYRAVKISLDHRLLSKLTLEHKKAEKKHYDGNRIEAAERYTLINE